MVSKGSDEQKNANLELRAGMENPPVVPFKNIPEWGVGTLIRIIRDTLLVGAQGTVADDGKRVPAMDVASPIVLL